MERAAIEFFKSIFLVCEDFHNFSGPELFLSLVFCQCEITDDAMRLTYCDASVTYQHFCGVLVTIKSR